jgi:hypothetical protein
MNVNNTNEQFDHQLRNQKQRKKCHGNRKDQRFRKKCRTRGMKSETVERHKQVSRPLQIQSPEFQRIQTE